MPEQHKTPPETDRERQDRERKAQKDQPVTPEREREIREASEQKQRGKGAPPSGSSGSSR